MTTAILAIAATWPAPRRAVVAELDPDGGTTAARQVVPHDPGLISLAADGAHGMSPELVAASIQQLANGTLALLAPPGPDRAVASLEALEAAGLPGVLGHLPGLDVLADCGRLDGRSPALPYLRGADAVVLVIRSGVEDVIGLKHRLQTLDLGPRPCGVVIVGRRPYQPGEVAEAFSLPVVGVLDDDARAATTVGTGGLPDRSRLLRSAEIVARELVRAIPGPTAVGLAGAGTNLLAAPSWRPPQRAATLRSDGINAPGTTGGRP